ncbi:hypothetical protein ATANTOWER_011641 [Ataeniobius toweri]|uniref:Secreted protein n=1 Tax=Ataeniobius toweri TaxID=208326 RepID=A0ABU7CIE5_9TELE|nr:hypothetical protein [Ataeniobius toweri]
MLKCKVGSFSCCLGFTSLLLLLQISAANNAFWIRLLMMLHESVAHDSADLKLIAGFPSPIRTTSTIFPWITSFSSLLCPDSFAVVSELPELICSSSQVLVSCSSNRHRQRYHLGRCTQTNRQPLDHKHDYSKRWSLNSCRSAATGCFMLLQRLFKEN